MNYKVIADSSANLYNINRDDFQSVPLHIMVADKDFVDDKDLNLVEMHQALSLHHGKTSTACPSSQEWMDAFDDADVVFCVTITSNLSGSCNSAMVAASTYESMFPERKVYVIDSLSTGPEMVLIVDKINELIKTGMFHEEIYKEVCDYQKKTHLYFELASLDNLAKNGRISLIIAKGIGILGIKIVGNASEKGTLNPLDKCRGYKRAFNCLISHMKQCGYSGGRVIISHTNNPDGAEEIKEMIKKELGCNDALIMENRGLCGFYAEPGSILVGFEA